MFKRPDSHRPREWAQPSKVNTWIFAAAIVVVAAIVIGFSVLPFGPEIALTLGAVVFAVVIFRRAT